MCVSVLLCVTVLNAWMISLCRGVFGSHCSLAGEQEDSGIAVVKCNGSARTKTELLAWVHLSSQHQRCCKWCHMTYQEQSCCGLPRRHAQLSKCNRYWREHNTTPVYECVFVFTLIMSSGLFSTALSLLRIKLSLTLITDSSLSRESTSISILRRQRGQSRVATGRDMRNSNLWAWKWPMWKCQKLQWLWRLFEAGYLIDSC